jgi:hypothetical protein
VTSALVHRQIAYGHRPGAPFAASLELARRTSASLGGVDTRVSVEVRSAVSVELRP